MKLLFNSRPFKQILFCSFFFAAITPSYAARYYFSQNFEGGGKLSGYFDGEDGGENGLLDGKIQANEGQFGELQTIQVDDIPQGIHEVSNFSLKISGIPAFNEMKWQEDYVPFILSYDITNNTLRLTSDFIWTGRYNGIDTTENCSEDWNCQWWGHYLSPGYLPTEEKELQIWFADIFPGEIHRINLDGPLTVSQTPPDAETPLPAAIFLFLPGLVSLSLFGRKGSKKNTLSGKSVI
jgi:hypothetical protein